MNEGRKKTLRLLGLESLEPEFKGDPQLSCRFCSLKRPQVQEVGAMHSFYAGIRSVSLSKRITSLRRNQLNGSTGKTAREVFFQARATLAAIMA